MDPVIVAGAGPVGLSLAVALTRHGVPCIVLDETDGRDEVRPARTAVLRPDTAAFLARLGCAETLGAEGTRWAAWRTVQRRRLLDRVAFAATGAVAVRTEEGDGTPYGAKPGDDGAHAPLSPIHVPQHALARALRTVLDHEPLAEVVTDSRVIELIQDHHGVGVHTRGPNGTWWRGSYLIGCDGPRSAVRKLLDIRFPGRTAVERHAVAALRTELPWPGEAVLHRAPPRRGAAATGRTGVWGGTTGEVTARPLPDGVWRLDWLLPPGRDLVTPDALVARIRDTLAGWTEPGTGTGGARTGAGYEGGDPAGGNGGADSAGGSPVPPYELLDTGVHTVHHRLARRWRSGRAFLAGDAAHLLGALGTQGLDEGLRDAENLAWKLGIAWHHGASDTLLDSYQTERRSAVAARLRAADQALPLLRDGGARGRLRGVVTAAGRGRMTLLTDGHLGRGPLGAAPAYHRSPLAPATVPAGAVRVDTEPGGPVEDVTVTAPDGSAVRLRERLGRGLLVVLVAPGTGVWDRRHWMSAGLMPQLTDAVAALPLPAEILVAEHYPGAAAHTVLLIRPDGHLVTALAGVRPEELRACAEALLGSGARGGANAPSDSGAGAPSGSGVEALSDSGMTGEPSGSGMTPVSGSDVAAWAAGADSGAGAGVDTEADAGPGTAGPAGGERLTGDVGADVPEGRGAGRRGTRDDGALGGADDGFDSGFDDGRG
ncbi:monooxygenase [Streptomyces sp. Ru73]|uniref:FAD-dependent monooxygenase n=1 Tax=Streptomyces sp. Ru73 TaxID=2080748 RepID=UPI000CDD9DC0|nr:FAD-dependent monooxygenase [Streptomyces sp. Ru73]POX39164.1 monooxygenase [Streptomyces sp. Ru73]